MTHRSEVHVLALHQYFIFANKMREDWLRELNGAARPLSEADMRRLWLLPYVHYWYAGLWVLIDGWRKLDLHDEDVDRLLRSRNCDHLERYRNGIFHFQPDYWRKRHSGLITRAARPVPWVFALNKAFGAAFLRLLSEARRARATVEDGAVPAKAPGRAKLASETGK